MKYFCLMKIFLIVPVFLCLFSYTAAAESGRFVAGDCTDSLGRVAPTRLDAGTSGVTVAWDVSLYGMCGTDGRLPFWAVTNRRGLFPRSLGPSSSGSRDGGRFTGGGLVTYGADVSYMTGAGIVLDAGVSLAGYGAPGDWAGMVDRPSCAVDRFCAFCDR